MEKGKINAQKAGVAAQRKIADDDLKALRKARADETKAVEKAAEAAEKAAEKDAKRTQQVADDLAKRLKEEADEREKQATAVAESKTGLAVSQQLGALNAALGGFKVAQEEAEAQLKQAQAYDGDTRAATTAIAAARDAQVRIGAMVNAVQAAKERGQRPLPVTPVPDAEESFAAGEYLLDTKTGFLSSQLNGQWAIQEHTGLVFDGVKGRWYVEVDGEWWPAKVGAPPTPPTPSFLNMTFGPWSTPSPTPSGAPQPGVNTFRVPMQGPWTGPGAPR